MEVHRVLGCGFPESVYHEALELEFRLRGLPSRSQPELSVFYKGQKLAAVYKPDFICFESVIVELKALSKLSGTEESQVLTYLATTGFEVGLLINFGRPSLEFQRFVRASSASLKE